MNENRLAWIDSLKGFLMLLVIMSHITFFPLNQLLGAPYMGVFFFLSGYTSSRWDDGSFVEKRAKRLLLPYCVYGIILVIIHCVRWTRVFGIDIKEYLLSIVGFFYCAYSYDKEGGQGMLRCDNSPMWFLPCMFVALIIARYIITSKKNRQAVRFLIVLGVALLLNSFSRWILPWSIDVAFVMSLVVVAGYLYRQYEKSIETYFEGMKPMRWIISMLIVFSYIALVEFNSGINVSIKEYGQYGTLSILLYLLIVFLGSWIYMQCFKRAGLNGVVGNTLSFIGRNSIAYLCVHLFIARLIQLYLGMLTDRSWIIGVSQMIGCMLAATLVVYLNYRLEDRIRICRYL